MTHAAEGPTKSPPSIPLIVIAGWLVPGAGYWLIGEGKRGTLVCVTIVMLFLMGLLIAGLRVIEVPGYDSNSGAEIRMIGNRRLLPRDLNYDNGNSWIMGGGFVSELANKPWFIPQIVAGPMCVGSAFASVKLAQAGFDSQRQRQVDYPRPHAPLETVGTLYTAIAGMLNLLVIMDAAYRAILMKELQASAVPA